MITVSIKILKTWPRPLSSISYISLVLSLLQIHVVNWASTMVDGNAEYTENHVFTAHHTAADCGHWFLDCFIGTAFIFPQGKNRCFPIDQI